MDLDNDVDVTRKMTTLEPGPGWQPDVQVGRARFHAGRTAMAARKRRCTLGVASAAFIVIGMSAFADTRALAARCVDACVSVTTRVGLLFKSEDAKAALDSARWLSRPARRPASPVATLIDAQGRRFSLADLEGKVVLVNFWATWCPPCLVEIPWFTEFQTRFRDRGLVVVGVSLDDDGWKSVGPFAETAAINYRLALASDDLLQAFDGIDRLPVTFLIDRQGRIAAKHLGIVSKADYERGIEKLIAED